MMVLRLSVIKMMEKKSYMIEYARWIELHYPTPQSALKQCEPAVHAMILYFPELTIVKGQAVVEEPHGFPSTKTDHWWCITAKGEVIDPTAHQYPTRIIRYEPLDESRVEPTGKCPNCGCFSYGGSTCCSEKCSKEYKKYIEEMEERDRK